MIPEYLKGLTPDASWYQKLGKEIKKGVDLGTRRTFSDLGQTISEILEAEKLENGESFKGMIL